VLVILKEEANLTFLLQPALLTTELHRLFYVAVSRAREKLFISVPTLDSAKETRLTNLFDIKGCHEKYRFSQGKSSFHLLLIVFLLKLEKCFS
jgi:hypothetical protein